MPCARAETFARADDRPIELVIYRLDGSMAFDAAVATLSAQLGAARRRDATGPAQPARSAEWRPGPTVTLTSDGAIYVAADLGVLAAPFRDALVAPYPWPTASTRFALAASSVGLADDDEVALARPGWRRAPVVAPPGAVDVLGSYDDVPVVVIGAYARPLPARVVTHTVARPNRGPGYHALRLDDDRTPALQARTLDGLVAHLRALGCEVRSDEVDDD